MSSVVVQKLTSRGRPRGSTTTKFGKKNITSSTAAVGSIDKYLHKRGGYSSSDNFNYQQYNNDDDDDDEDYTRHTQQSNDDDMSNQQLTEDSENDGHKHNSQPITLTTLHILYTNIF